MRASTTCIRVTSFRGQCMSMSTCTTGRRRCICSRSSCTMHRVTATSSPSVSIPPNVMGMASSTACCSRTSRKGMRVTRYLTRCQCYCSCSTSFFHGIEITVGCVNPHWHPTTAPCHPSASKISSGIGRSDTHIDAAHRIHGLSKLLDVFFQKHPINFHIPVLRNLKGIISF